MARLEPAARLPTIWTTPDDLWEQFILPLLREHDPEPRTGRPRIDQRKAFDGVIFITRTGCQWNALPSRFGNDSSVHRTYQRWVRLGLFERLWATLVEYARKLGLVDWDWQSSDTSTGKARFKGGDSGPNPTDRAKPGTQRSVLTEGNGYPIACVVAAANVHDSKRLDATLEAVVVEPPNPIHHKQHLCLDKGYDTPDAEAATRAWGNTPHIRRIGEEKLDPAGEKTRPARRWVSERCLSWWNGCRSILTRWAKRSDNDEAFIDLRSALLWYRRIKLRNSVLG